MADERYWTYCSSAPTPVYMSVPPWVFGGTEQEWHSLSPGMRREIVRSYARRTSAPVRYPPPPY
jgi:hypothetical protein